MAFKNHPNCFQLGFIIHLLCVCAHACVCVPAPVQRSEDNLEELILSLHHVVPGIKFKLSGLAASGFTCCSILLVHLHDLVYRYGDFH